MVIYPGCQKLLILVDHKPLIGLLTKRELGAIKNPCLEHLAERLLRWTFKIEHVAGASNHGPDALSWFPGPATSHGGLGSINKEASQWSAHLEGEVLAIAASRLTLVISWEMVRDAGVSDQEQSTLLHALTNDDESVWSNDVALKPYKQFRGDITVDGVPLYKGRVVVSSSLRPDVLATLHRAHQGTTGMALRAQDTIVWWPGFTADIQSVMDRCLTCVKNAPSQPSLPSHPLPRPQHPMQLLACTPDNSGTPCPATPRT